MIVVDYYVFGGCWFDCSFIACLRVITLTALRTAGVFLSCVHDYRAFGTVQAVHKTTNNRWQSVVISHELVSCGNRGNSDGVVEWVPAAMLVQFPH